MQGVLCKLAGSLDDVSSALVLSMLSSLLLPALPVGLPLSLVLPVPQAHALEPMPGAREDARQVLLKLCAPKQAVDARKAGDEGRVRGKLRCGIGWVGRVGEVRGGLRCRPS